MKKQLNLSNSPLISIKNLTDLDVLRFLIDIVEKERLNRIHQSYCIDHLIETEMTQDNRINDLEQKSKETSHILDEYGENIDFLVSKVKKLEYLADRNQELELRENPYSCDGDANCNS